MDRSHAEKMIHVLILAEREGRWTPRPETRDAMNGVERALCISIQAGQPALEEMNARLMSTYGDKVMEQVRADYAACRIACPNLDEIRLFGSPSTVVAHDFSRPALARAA